MHNPLVSIVVTNYNYGRYLKQCLLSALNQSYKNIELIIGDNNSTDNSMEIITELLSQYNDRITFIRHNQNFGPAHNALSAFRLIKGQYFLNLGADDILHPKFIEVAVKLFQEHPNISQIVAHADAIDDNDLATKRAPFFNDSYYIKGISYAAILMVAGVTRHTSQTLFKTSSQLHLSSMPDYIFSHTLGERSMAFMNAVAYDLIYLNHSFVTCRESPNNQTSKMNRDISQIVEQWSLIEAFSSYAKHHGHEAVYSRRDEAIVKLGSLCERYATELYQLGAKDIAARYLGLSLVLSGNLDDFFANDTPLCINTLAKRMEPLFNKLKATGSDPSLLRRHSYEAPIGSIRLNIMNDFSSFICEPVDSSTI